MPNMYKGSLIAQVDTYQVHLMKKAGWSSEIPVKEDKKKEIPKAKKKLSVGSSSVNITEPSSVDIADKNITNKKATGIIE